MSLIEEVQKRMYAFYDDPGDPKNQPRGRTYGQVVKPPTPKEMQRRIDIVNGLRGHGPLAEFQGDGVA